MLKLQEVATNFTHSLESTHEGWEIKQTYGNIALFSMLDMNYSIRVHLVK